jgi:hypothetical protein
MPRAIIAEEEDVSLQLLTNCMITGENRDFFCHILDNIIQFMLIMAIYR